MIDFSKIYCQRHPSENIINFCAHEDCCVVLCATCVCEHTKMHVDGRTEPKYENIRKTFQRMHQMVQNQIRTISGDSQKLVGFVVIQYRLFDTIQRKKISFRETIQQAKKDALKTVGDYFEEMEMKWEGQMLNEQKKYSLHNEYRLDLLRSLISKQNQRLIEKARKMNSSGFVEQVQRLERQVLFQSKKIHQRVMAQIEENEQYKPMVSYMKENLVQVRNALSKLMNLRFNIPVQRILGNMDDRRMSNSCSSWKAKESEERRQTPVKGQRESFNVPTVVKRMNEKPLVLQPQLTQSVLVRPQFNQSVMVPRVLTSSLMQSALASPVCCQPEKPRASQVIFSPKYIDGVDLMKFSKMQKCELGKSGKSKKGGLTLFTAMHQSDTLSIDKENSKR